MLDYIYHVTLKRFVSMLFVKNRLDFALLKRVKYC